MITLTPAGVGLSERVTILLEFAQSTLESVAVAEDRPLRIASNATIAAFWLPQRLKSFALSELACPIELVSSYAKDLVKDTSLDLAIIHGEPPHDAHASKLLFPDRLVPVIAPGAAKTLGVGRGGSIFDISRSSRPSLMDYRQIQPHWSNWMTWLDPEERDDWDIETCTTYAQSIGRALEGKGLALASPDILADELSRGSLTPIGPTRTREQLGYWIVKPAGRWPHPSVDDLIQFLLA